MSPAEKLIAKGMQIGLIKGEWIGRIFVMEKCLALPFSSKALLVSLTASELEARHAELMRASEKMLKR